VRPISPAKNHRLSKRATRWPRAACQFTRPAGAQADGLSLRWIETGEGACFLVERGSATGAIDEQFREVFCGSVEARHRHAILPFLLMVGVDFFHPCADAGTIAVHPFAKTDRKIFQPHTRGSGEGEEFGFDDTSGEGNLLRTLRA